MCSSAAGTHTHLQPCFRMDGAYFTSTRIIKSSRGTAASPGRCGDLQEFDLVAFRAERCLIDAVKQNPTCSWAQKNLSSPAGAEAGGRSSNQISSSFV